jgi:WD40 repeat protein
VSLWDTSTGVEIAKSVQGIGENRGAIAFTPDGRNIVVVDRVGFVRRFDAETLQPLQPQVMMRLPGIVNAHGIRATRDGVIAVTSSGPGDPTTTVVFADVDEDAVIRSQTIAATGLRANFSPDGRRYGFGSDDGTVGVIDVATGATVGTQERVHQAPVSWVAFSPDSATMFSLGFDGQLAISDAADAMPFARLDTGKPSISATVFPGEGATMLLAYQDGEVLAFDTDPSAWVAHACAVAGRNFTEAEWRDALGGRPYRATCPHAPAP